MAILTTLMAVGIIALGVTLVGAQIFMALMAEHGESTEGARSTFDASVTIVVIAAVVAAILAATLLAVVLGRRLARPLREIGVAARRIAAGDYAARVPTEGPTRWPAWARRSTRWPRPSRSRSGCGATSSPTRRTSCGRR